MAPSRSLAPPPPPEPAPAVGGRPPPLALSPIASCELVFDAAGATNGGQAVVWIDDEQQDASAPRSKAGTGSQGTTTTEMEPGEAANNPSSDVDSSLPITATTPPTLVYSSHSVLHLATREAFTIGRTGGAMNESGSGGSGSSPQQQQQQQQQQQHLLLWRRQTSLRSSRTNLVAPSPAASASSTASSEDEVITCLAHVAGGPSQSRTTSPVDPSSASESTGRAPTAIAVGYSSGRILVWMRKPTRSDDEPDFGRGTSCLVEPPWTEHSAVEPPESDRERDPVTVLDGLWLREDGKPTSTLVLVSGSCGGGTVHVCRVGSTSGDGPLTYDLHVTHKCVLTESPLASVRAVPHEGDVLFLLGSAAPRHNKIHVHQCRHSDLLGAAVNDSASEKAPGSDSITVRAAGALHGHQDWVTCFDWRRGVLASGSKDCRIRLWNFAVAKSRAQPGEEAAGRSDAETTEAPGQCVVDNDDADPFDDEISTGPGDGDGEDDEQGESRLDLVHDSSQTSILLDALLIGHEGAVTSVQWHPDPSSRFGGRDLVLLSASMDRTVLIWALQDDDDGDGRSGSGGAVWTPLPRLGVAGGILGGPLGSSLLGFCRAVWEPRYGRSIVGHAYGGALHVWSMDTPTTGDEPASSAPDQTPRNEGHVPTTTTPIPLLRWRAMPGLTGHFDAVTDLCWERFRGTYFVTVSKDQTCRLWAPMNTFHQGVKVPMWAEISRPQVHGYDLMSVSSLSACASPHRIVTAADEKELRVYDAPLLTTRALERLCGAEATPDSNDGVTRVLRAYIPSLGLTNKSSVTDVAQEEEEVEQDESDALARNASVPFARVPLERDLGVTSVWPEQAKFYGHNAELYRVTSTIDAAEFPGASNDSVLVASSSKARDSEAASIRLWNARTGKCLQILSSHKSTVVSMSFSSNGQYLASSGKDRRICLWEKQKDGFSIAWLKDSAHKRIVWSIHFNPSDPTVFASGSRDGSVKVWKITPQPACSVELMHSFTPTSFITGKPTSVTSVAFAPIIVGSNGYLAVGTEPGLMAVWQVPTDDEGSPVAVLSIPLSMSHGCAVTKLDWRRNNDDRSGLYLASSSSDHSCKVFNIELTGNKE